MSEIIAAIGNDAAAGSVMAAASSIAHLYGATVEPLHVREDDAELAATAVQAAGSTLRTLEGDRYSVLARAAEPEEVDAVVVAAEGWPDGKRPLATTALKLISSLDKPVIVVPPRLVARRITSVLVPLDGTLASAAALRGIVAVARDTATEVVVAHVLEEESLPAFSDHLPHEVRAWADEFIARYCPDALDARLELRVGAPGAGVLDVLRESDCGLVALGWGQDLGLGRAAVVRELLANSPVPVLLAPMAEDEKASDRM
jgi:nucleotide-binding universal stress UspA family protein